MSYSRCILLAALALCATAAPAHGQTDIGSGFNVNGDFRLRYENTTHQEFDRRFPDLNNSRNRGVVRFRAGVTKRINGLAELGARLATGAQDDPNTADVTLGAFVDDIDVSLDRVYLNLNYHGVFVTGGKFANPFLRTDLVWDGDVNPQGIAGSYTFLGDGPVTPKVSGIYSIVDEQALVADSDMLGGQVSLSADPDPYWRFTVAGGYYDYNISSLSSADAGDTRSNNLVPDGTAYLSDFDLLDVIAVVEYQGFGERYGVRFVGDYVKNLGAAVDADQGFMLDLFVGRASEVHDVRFRYGYAEAETDAVLAAFSNDNTTIATNYMQHTLTVDYVAVENMTLNATWYLYRRKESEAAADGGKEFVSRLRLNVVVRF